MADEFTCNACEFFFTRNNQQSEQAAANARSRTIPGTKFPTFIRLFTGRIWRVSSCCIRWWRISWAAEEDNIFLNYSSNFTLMFSEFEKTIQSLNQEILSDRS